MFPQNLGLVAAYMLGALSESAKGVATLHPTQILFRGLVIVALVLLWFYSTISGQNFRKESVTPPEIPIEENYNH